MKNVPAIGCAILSVAVCLGWTFRSAAAEDATSFHEDVIPILTRFGCNTGGCHGKLAGQNGFRLSLRGYAPELDYETLTREARGRRINPAAPDQSLLLRKATGRMPHGGGQRIEPGSEAYRVLLDWLAAGAPGPLAEEARVDRIEIAPAASTLMVGQSQSLSVTGIYEDGRRRDVTWLTQFAPGDASTVEVSPAGEAMALRHGEAVVRATFQGQVEIATFTVPHETETDPKWYTPGNNAIDVAVMAKLAALRIEPAPLCDDATFLRRVHLDLIGRLPTPAEVRAFLDDAAPDKRARTIDALLERPEFVDYWAMWLGDLLQNRKERDHDVRGAKGVRAFHSWLREQLAQNRNWRDIASDVLLAEGKCDENPAAGYYIVTVGEKAAEQSEVADSVAQAFLGTRIGCARCHNHPLEKYTQDDYYHFVGFFSRVALDRVKPEEGATELLVGTREIINLRRQIEKEREKLTAAKSKADAGEVEQSEKRIAELEQRIADERAKPAGVHQPRTGQMLAPRPLDRSPLEIAAGEDPRQPLVRWITDPSNEAFSGAMVNRLWKHFLGIGLVEPVDDLRATNPPSNAALWNTLNREFVNSDYDMKHVMRLIANSRTYQLAVTTTASNARDNRFHSHFYARRLEAAVLLDAICDATGVPEPFAGYPRGVRAMQVPDPAVDSHFLITFGRSERVTACACEAKMEVTLPQLLLMQNNDGLMGKLQSPEGRLHQLLADESKPADEIVDELFLATVSRLPTAEERQKIVEIIAGSDRREAMVDVFWAMLNSKEFAFCH